MLIIKLQLRPLGSAAAPAPRCRWPRRARRGRFGGFWWDEVRSLLLLAPGVVCWAGCVAKLGSVVILNITVAPDAEPRRLGLILETAQSIHHRHGCRVEQGRAALHACKALLDKVCVECVRRRRGRGLGTISVAVGGSAGAAAAAARRLGQEDSDAELVALALVHARAHHAAEHSLRERQRTLRALIILGGRGFDVGQLAEQRERRDGGRVECGVEGAALLEPHSGRVAIVDEVDCNLVALHASHLGAVEGLVRREERGAQGARLGHGCQRGGGGGGAKRVLDARRVARCRVVGATGLGVEGGAVRDIGAQKVHLRQARDGRRHARGSRGGGGLGGGLGLLLGGVGAGFLLVVLPHAQACLHRAALRRLEGDGVLGAVCSGGDAAGQSLLEEGDGEVLLPLDHVHEAEEHAILVEGLHLDVHLALQQRGARQRQCLLSVGLRHRARLVAPRGGRAAHACQGQ
mmetsp:Transcript_7249/g.19742  ORF Transcript_7249/g.19742 Transcript_7249/m.19742 type:complete len:462 (-) Transcript_7249:992-2377(-)